LTRGKKLDRSIEEIDGYIEKLIWITWQLHKNKKEIIVVEKTDSFSR
jgi:hypothetical protein